MVQQAPRILMDGMSLGLEEGTGITTYAQTLAYAFSDLGADVGILYGRDVGPRINRKTTTDMEFFDISGARPRSRIEWLIDRVAAKLSLYGHAIPNLPYRAYLVDPANVVDLRHIQNRLAKSDYLVNCRNIFERAYQQFRIVGRMSKVALPAKIDVLHLSYPLPISIPHAKLVTTIHDIVPLTLPFTTLDEKALYYRLIKKLLSSSDLVTTVSETTSKDLQRVFGVDDSKIAVTYQTTNYHLSNSPEPLDTGLLKNVYNLLAGDYLLFVGAIEPKKNLNRLLDAFLSSDVETPLVVVGRKAWLYEKELQILDQAELQINRMQPRALLDAISDGNRALAQRIVHAKNVILLDHVPFRHLRHLYTGAKALLFPSLAEGFGLPPIEAMTLGCPVVTSNHPALQEVCDDAALFVDPYDPRDIKNAILKIDKDEQLRKHLKKKGTERSKHYSMDHYRNRLRNAYRRVNIEFSE